MTTKFDLTDLCEIAYESPFSFSKHSSIGCGGQAKIAFYPQSVEEALSLVRKLRLRGIPYLTLGNLTNVLPPDDGFDGVILSTKRLTGVRVGEKTFAYAGTTAVELLSACRRGRRTGAEFLLGIPCTVGGALYMNAGAGGRYIAEIVESVLVLRDGELKALPVEECNYAYKHSVFMQNDDVILGASFSLTEASEEEIDGKRAEYAERRKHLPIGKSMGCVFKNPEGQFAGALIEGSGLKGLRLGGVRVAESHANFIINDRGGTSGQIKCLISLIKNAVYAQYGVRLQEEIRYI